MTTQEDDILSDLRQGIFYQSKDAIDLKPLSMFYFKKEFVEKCLKDIEFIPVRVALGEDVTNLEILAIELLLSAAGINREAYKR